MSGQRSKRVLSVPVHNRVPEPATRTCDSGTDGRGARCEGT